jgi:sugar lactone lactonase YvrE
MRPGIFVLVPAIVALSTSVLLADRVELVAGGGQAASGARATETRLVVPFGVDFDGEGNTYIVEFDGNRVHRIDRSGVLTTIAGDGSRGNAGDNGPAAAATFDGMHAVSVHPKTGDIYLADTRNNSIRRILSKDGRVERFAGTGKSGFSGDNGPALEATFAQTISLALDPRGATLYVVDQANKRIRAIDMTTRVVRTIAGNGQMGAPIDGSMAAASPLVDPRAVAIDSRNNIYVLERNGHALRVIDSGGRIRTVVNTAGKQGASGDGGPGTAATMNAPKHICIDRQDRVVIADAENHVIRRYDPRTGTIERIAGTGLRGTSGVGGASLQVQLNRPHGVTVAPDGTLYIVDSHNHRVLRIVE